MAKKKQKVEQMVAYKVHLDTIIEALTSARDMGVEYIDLALTAGDNEDSVDIYIQDEYVTGFTKLTDEADLEHLA